MHLIARHAGSALWLARYMERIENLARLLDVTKTFARDAEDGRNWLSMLRINGDEAAFFAKHAAPRQPAWRSSICWTRTTRPRCRSSIALCAGECAHVAGADLHRDVAADQRVPRPDLRAERDRHRAGGTVRASARC